MPIYEYECEVHGVIEKWVGMKEEEPTKCDLLTDMGNGPVCESPLRKLISRGYFYFNHHLKH